MASNNNNNGNHRLSSLLVQQIHQFLKSYRNELKNNGGGFKSSSRSSTLKSSSSTLSDPFQTNVPDPTTANALNTATVVLRKTKKKKSPYDGVPLSNYRIRPREIQPEVFDWICHYLWLKNCPIELATIVANKISFEMSMEMESAVSAATAKAATTDNFDEMDMSTEDHIHHNNNHTLHLNHHNQMMDTLTVDSTGESTGDSLLSAGSTVSLSPSDRSSLPNALCSHDVARQSRELVDEYLDELGSNPDHAVSMVNDYLLTDCNSPTASKDGVDGSPTTLTAFTSSIHARKNRRQSMEDRHVIIHNLNKALNLDLPKTYSYYAIFDGHAGVDAASYSTAHLHHYLVESEAFRNGQMEQAFREAFKKTDSLYIKRLKEDGVDKLKPSGSTALCALIEDNKTVYLAWAGDSQAVLVRNGCHEEIMLPHKPDMESERIRIQDQGGFVIYMDTWRVNGILSVTRAIGDPEHKALIIADPSFSTFEIDSTLDFLVLGCDGLFDHLTGQDITSHVFEFLCKHENKDPEMVIHCVSEYLSEMAVAEGSSDNITSIVIFFKPFEQLVATGLPSQSTTTSTKPENNGQPMIDDGAITTLPTTNGGHFPYTDFAELPIGTNYKLTSDESYNDTPVQEQQPETLETPTQQQTQIEFESEQQQQLPLDPNDRMDNDKMIADQSSLTETTHSNLIGNEKTMMTVDDEHFEIIENIEKIDEVDINYEQPKQHEPELNIEVTKPGENNVEKPIEPEEITPATTINNDDDLDDLEEECQDEFDFVQTNITEQQPKLEVAVDHLPQEENLEYNKQDEKELLTTNDNCANLDQNQHEEKLDTTKEKQEFEEEKHQQKLVENIEEKTKETIEAVEEEKQKQEETKVQQKPEEIEAVLDRGQSSAVIDNNNTGIVDEPAPKSSTIEEPIEVEQAPSTPTPPPTTETTNDMETIVDNDNVIVVEADLPPTTNIVVDNNNDDLTINKMSSMFMKNNGNDDSIVATNLSAHDNPMMTNNPFADGQQFGTTVPSAPESFLIHDSNVQQSQQIVDLMNNFDDEKHDFCFINSNEQQSSNIGDQFGNGNESSNTMMINPMLLNDQQLESGFHQSGQQQKEYFDDLNQTIKNQFDDEQLNSSNINLETTLKSETLNDNDLTINNEQPIVNVESDNNMIMNFTDDNEDLMMMENGEKPTVVPAESLLLQEEHDTCNLIDEALNQQPTTNTGELSSSKKMDDHPPTPANLIDDNFDDEDLMVKKSNLPGNTDTLIDSFVNELKNVSLNDGHNKQQIELVEPISSVLVDNINQFDPIPKIEEKPINLFELSQPEAKPVIQSEESGDNTTTKTDVANEFAVAAAGASAAASVPAVKAAIKSKISADPKSLSEAAVAKKPAGTATTTTKLSTAKSSTTARSTVPKSTGSKPANTRPTATNTSKTVPAKTLVSTEKKPTTTVVPRTSKRAATSKPPGSATTSRLTATSRPKTATETGNVPAVVKTSVPRTTSSSAVRSTTLNKTSTTKTATTQLPKPTTSGVGSKITTRSPLSKPTASTTATSKPTTSTGAKKTITSTVTSKVGSIRPTGTSSSTLKNSPKPTTSAASKAIALKSSTTTRTTAKTLKIKPTTNNTQQNDNTKKTNVVPKVNGTRSPAAVSAQSPIGGVGGGSSNSTTPISMKSPTTTTSVKLRSNIISVENSLKQELEDAVMNEMNKQQQLDINNAD